MLTIADGGGVTKKLTIADEGGLGLQFSFINGNLENQQYVKGK